MKEYVWLFPVLFIFHDMEEIIGFMTWYQKNKTLLDKKYPAISKTYANASTEGFSFAVFEELILCILICIFSINANWYGLWLGGFIACTLHFVIHIIQSLVIKKYIPALATSILALPFSIRIISNSLKILKYSIPTIFIYSIFGTVIIAINIEFAHTLMHKFTIWQRNS
ncbi:MAG: HXXEE domain-containing protein [Lachnospiraceae bacterium]|nr:HXXEE domain-containing protein [Lachnospiraceae bacterium]